MTTTNPFPETADAVAVSQAGRSPYRPLLRLGGVCLAAAPVLLVLGAATSPPQESDSNADYVASLAADRFQTAMSADFFHYSWVLWAFGFLAVIALVPGRRGRTLTSVLAVLGAVTSVQLSGLLLTDFYLASIAHHADVATGAEVLGDLGPSVSVWLATGQPAALLIPLVFLGLARAGVMRWWVAVLPVLNIALFVLSLPEAVALALALVTFAPAYLAAVQLIRGRRTTSSSASF